MKQLFLSTMIAIGLITSCSNSDQTGNAIKSLNGYVAANDTCKKIDEYLSQLEKEKNFSGGLLILKNGE